MESNQCFLQGSESKLYLEWYNGQLVIRKWRYPRSYRHATIDARLRKRRTKAEKKALEKCYSLGVSAPSLVDDNIDKTTLYIGYLHNTIQLGDYINKMSKDEELDQEHVIKKLNWAFSEFGRLVANLHSHDLIHGDLTSSNVLVELEKNHKYLKKITLPTKCDHAIEKQVPLSSNNIDSFKGEKLHLVDFGLSSISLSAESKAVDLHLLERTIQCRYDDQKYPNLFNFFMDSYYKHVNCEFLYKQISQKLDSVRKRYRKIGC
ncbi:hypothetical protein A3Q56_00324 [Intoshia linei]|uniref:non-specific serine/threonine protein kinase n=1 Tax=Intoshia linei TaxID=1819745 RepID=A0A177BCB6_9BILA|nr:hypothetical protein A3Q56_00324 [Intoshia linei]